MLSAGKFRYLATAGRPVTKISTDAMMNGDHPLSTVVTECCVTAVSVTAVLAPPGASGMEASSRGAGGSPPVGMSTGGFQTFRNATITSSENTAATMSTSPTSW